MKSSEDDVTRSQSLKPVKYYVILVSRYNFSSFNQFLAYHNTSVTVTLREEFLTFASQLNEKNHGNIAKQVEKHVLQISLMGRRRETSSLDENRRQ